MTRKEEDMHWIITAYHAWLMLNRAGVRFDTEPFEHTEGLCIVVSPTVLCQLANVLVPGLRPPLQGSISNHMGTFCSWSETLPVELASQRSNGPRRIVPVENMQHCLVPGLITSEREGRCG